jgi:hypothetical protein
MLDKDSLIDPGTYLLIGDSDFHPSSMRVNIQTFKTRLSKFIGRPTSFLFLK